MSRMVALGAVLGFAAAVLALALLGKEPPHPAPAPEPAPAPLVIPQPLLRPVPVRRDLLPNGPMRAVLPPQARPLVVVTDAGAQ
ncbi:MAG: hypothetical protein QM723_03970 [Myxococcaceae bacterium]